MGLNHYYIYICVRLNDVEWNLSPQIHVGHLRERTVVFFMFGLMGFHGLMGFNHYLFTVVYQ